MPSARHFSSDMRKLASMIGVLALAGCVGNGPLLESVPGLRLGTHDAVETEAVVAALRPTVVDPQQAVVVPVSGKAAKPVPVSGRSSQWCDYLREDAAAQSTIMRSPTLSGSLDDEARASLSLGVSVSSMLKADLTEQSAEVRCRRYLAETGLQKLVFVSPQGLTSAGHKAKLKSINGQRKEIARLRAKAVRAMNAGDLDREKATAIQMLADQILAEASAAQSQADRRLETTVRPDASAKEYGAALLAAEAELEDINSRMRTFDAMDVSLSAGWNDDINQDGFDVNDKAFSGKVSFSVKLGALAPNRFAHERAAKDAKLSAIRDEEGGALWQVAVLRRAHERAIAGLVDQQHNLDQAIAKAQTLAGMLAEVADPAFEPPLIQAKLQLIKLRSDKAAVAGSIAEIRDNMKRLKAG